MKTPTYSIGDTIPHGTWYGDLFNMGLATPASYVVPNTEIRCTHNSIDCIASNGNVVSRTIMWNDNWVPSYPKDGSTRCGTATMVDQRVLSETMERFGRKLAFFIRLQIWDREKDYGDYSKSERTFFFIEWEY